MKVAVRQVRARDTGEALVRHQHDWNEPGDQEALFPFQVGGQADWLRAISHELERLQELPFNWNSYGALQISPDSARHAANLASSLALEEELPAPQASATADGNVMLCWYGTDSSVEFECLPSGVFKYVTYMDGEEIEGTTRSIDRLAELASKV
jgi:hypothetical protein